MGMTVPALESRWNRQAPVLAWVQARQLAPATDGPRLAGQAITAWPRNAEKWIRFYSFFITG